MIFILITVIKTCCKTVTTVTKRMSGCHFVPNIPQKAIFRQFQKGFLHNILLRTQTMYENLSRIFIFNPQTLKFLFQPISDKNIPLDIMRITKKSSRLTGKWSCEVASSAPFFSHRGMKAKSIWHFT